MAAEESQVIITQPEIKETEQVIMNNNNKDLFEIENNKNNQPIDRMKRIQCISRYYVKWINNHKSDKTHSNIYDIINTKLSESYNFQHFLLDYRFIINRKDLLLLLNSNLNDDNCNCNINTCTIMVRHNRDREYYGDNNIKRNELYFMNNNNNNHNNEEMSRNICTQQILDSLHSFLDHTLHMDNNSLFNQFYHTKKNENDDIEFDSICNDKYAEKIIEVIENEMKSSNRYLNNNNNNNHKFITMATTTICFMDNFILEIFKSEMKKCNMMKMYNLLQKEEYDSESILQDLEFSDEYEECSNLRLELSDCITFLDLSNKLLIEKQVSLSLYKCGFRYFYWDYYKENSNETSVIFGQVTGDYNVGYQLKDWYIYEKYENLKYELLNNKIKRFSVEQYKTTLIKATDKLNIFNSDELDYLICNVDCWEVYYGIQKNQQISLQHILALLFYTNYSEQCYEFSATYRKMNAYETDIELKQRHCEYHNWGKLLRECVECFGTSMENSKCRVFFHGIGASLIFNSTTIRLCGPVSTSGKFDIAVNVFGRGGIVLDIKRRNVNQFYFNCPYWSDFTHEDEKLFIGGLVHFEFDTIRDLKNKQNYYNYIQPLTMFHFMIEGWQFKERIKKWHYKVLKLLIKEEMNEKILKYNVDSIVPKYVLKLWHHFLSQIKQVEINWRYMKMNETSPSKQRFGYKVFSPTFCLKHYTSLDFNRFIHLLPNLETITIYNRKNNKFIPSIALSKIFTTHILKSIEFINNNKNRVAMNQFNIVLPVDHDEEIEFFILENQQQFYQKGWQLKSSTFNSRFHHAFNVCYHTLCITKLS